MKGRHICIIGGGPAGLMAAERLSASGHQVHVYDAMPTFGRKFLLAGKSGLNITHSEAYEQFRTRFGAASDALAAALDAFRPDDVRAWAAGLGTETFVGTSGRVFPTVMKASPLLRAWLRRLDQQGVTFHSRHRMVDLAANQATFETPDGLLSVEANAILLALGGASWPRLGSDAAWVSLLARQGVSITPFRPANCGFERDWSEIFVTRFAGEPVKSVMAHSDAGSSQGEFVISDYGIEGSLIYAHAAALRDRLEQTGAANLLLDLAPGRSEDRIAEALSKQSSKISLSNRLRKAAGFDGVKVALLREILPADAFRSSEAIAKAIKALPLDIARPRPIEEAISSAGGIRLDAINDHYMLNVLPGIFAAGEMLDWEAPTGGYLLTACFATGLAAAKGIEGWLVK
ncbi:TIGR03862 family flavoprotein [Rhizobium oryzicola]|uniref:TIGR03862 family flavoprotein n=1 Tax=Rhizobium oryzicola TaxID=1232668 RepID=A0ABT8SRM1_9HYPH|nr:TIGR03862 family flavoprotein [Rhizobium oryzicola]MDO1580981.1 TIGR03862 family flavoprotein [Rhizobium oryzicola]